MIAVVSDLRWAMRLSVEPVLDADAWTFEDWVRGAVVDPRGLRRRLVVACRTRLANTVHCWAPPISVFADIAVHWRCELSFRTLATRQAGIGVA